MEQIIKFLMEKPSQTSAIVAMFAVFVSLLSIILTVTSLYIQRKHDFLSVRPIGYISQANYEDRIAVTLHNYGVGPLIITKLVVSDKTQSKNTLIDWMPPDIIWSTFVNELDDKGRPITPDRKIILVELKGDLNDAHFALARDRSRKCLDSLTVELHYTDIYNRTMPPAHRKLEFQ
jgi:hypothetical protein